MDELGKKFKESVKSVIKSSWKKLLLITIIVIVIVLLTSSSLYIIRPKDFKSGSDDSKAYTDSVDVSSIGVEKAKLEMKTGKVVESRLIEIGKTESEIEKMSDKEKLEYLGINNVTSMDEISAVEVLWKTNEVYSKYLNSSDDLEKLLNAEIITQYPYFGETDEEESINGVIKFKRKLQNGQDVDVIYVNESTFNSYKTTYESNPTDANRTTLQSCFTMTETGIIKIATINEERIEISTTDTEMTLESAQEKFGEEGRYTLQETTNGYIAANYTVDIQTINYLNMVKKYTMPFEYLWAMAVIADDDGEFALKLADYCYNSEMIVTIYDNISTYTEEDEYNYKRQNKTETFASIEMSPEYNIEFEKEKEWVEETPVEECLECTLNYKKIKNTNTISSGLTKANTWLVDFEAQYNSISNTEERPETGEQIEIPTETEYRQIGETQEYTYNISTGVATGDAELVNNEHAQELLNNANTVYEQNRDNAINQYIQSRNYNGLSSYLSSRGYGTYENNVRLVLNSVENIEQLRNLTPSEIDNIEGISITGPTEVRYLIRQMAVDYLTNVIIELTNVKIENFEREIDIEQLHYEYSSSTYYSRGTTTSREAVDPEDGETLKFVKAFNSSSKARSNILEVSSWLFGMLEDEEETANMVDITKYLLNQATSSTRYGTDLDFDVIWNSMFQNNLSTSGDISLTTSLLSRDEFISALEEYGGRYDYVEYFRNNAGKIYDIATEVGVNPEIVITKALGESEFEKKAENNYNFWGYNTPNGEALYVLNADCEENAGGIYGDDDFEVAVYVFCNYMLNYLPGGEHAGKIEERYQSRLENNCNPNGYGEVGTFKGYLSVYSWIGWYHIVGDSGSGGLYYLKVMYGDEFEEKCGAHEDGTSGPGGHKLGDLTTIQEQADYTAWQYEQQVRTWETIFGNYASITSLTSNGVVREENQASMEQILNPDWADDVESQELKTFINKLFGELGKTASDYGFNNEWCAMWTSTMFMNYGPSNFITRRIDSVNGIIQIDGSIQTAEVVYNSNASAFSRKDTSYVPKSGDICLWKGKNSDGSVASHVGIVYACDGQYIWMIDGNAGTTRGWQYSHVINRVMSVNDTRISGYYPSSELFN